MPGVQYLKASTSVDSNYRAARRGRSRKEFIAKLGVIVEEIDECVNWLELMQQAEIADHSMLLGNQRNPST